MTAATNSDPKTYSPGLNLYSYLVALLVLIAIAAGAVVTSFERPISAVPLAQPPPSVVSFEIYHRWIAVLAIVLIVVLAAWLSRSAKHGRLSRFAWVALVAFLIEAGLGEGAHHRSLAPLTDILHALIGPICLAAVWAVATITSKRWQNGPAFIEDSWRPSLHSLSLFLPAIVLLQILLGAAFRYRAASVIWHILNAMIVLLSILIVTVFLVRQFPTHPSLRPAAIALAGIASVQVALGFTTFMLLLLMPETSMAVVVVSVIHVATGALTLAATISLALQIRYNIRSTDIETARNVP